MEQVPLRGNHCPLFEPLLSTFEDRTDCIIDLPLSLNLYRQFLQDFVGSGSLGKDTIYGVSLLLPCNRPVLFNDYNLLMMNIPKSDTTISPTLYDEVVVNGGLIRQSQMSMLCCFSSSLVQFLTTLLSSLIDDSEWPLCCSGPAHLCVIHPLMMFYF